MTSSCAYPAGGKQWILHDYLLQEEADGLWTAVDLDDGRPPLAARTRQGLEWLICCWHRTLQEERRSGQAEATGERFDRRRGKPRVLKARPFTPPAPEPAVAVEPVEPVQLQAPEPPQEPQEQQPPLTLEPWLQQGIQQVLARRGLVAAA